MAREEGEPSRCSEPARTFAATASSADHALAESLVDSFKTELITDGTWGHPLTAELFVLE